ncbi:MAG: DUF4920 domain-containing protein [Planctomycetes bacterium]|nr:DUF4920 domain-containing protein [Planctomycetota bacterium]
MRLLLIPLTLLLFAPACDRHDHDADVDKHDAGTAKAEGCADNGGEECKTTDQEQAVLTKADPAGAYGMGLTLTDFTKVDDILADPASFEGKRVLVKGNAVKVCEKRGCWVQIAGEEPFKAILVKVNDGEIVFPLSCRGKEVTVEGMVEKIETPVETLREAAKKKADEAGETFDPESITEPKITWRIKGLGAKI